VENNLRSIRQERGLPLLGLAAKTRVSTTTLGMIERFDYLPSERVRTEIAQALNVSVATIWPRLSAEGRNVVVTR
jgi:transcriptional regulator with XRE-family HTH domain